MIPSKTFGGNITANAVSLQTFLSTTLGNNNTYISSNVVSSKQFSIDNGFVSGYSSIDSTSFDTAAVTPEIQEAAEQRLADIKTEFVNSRFLD
jgi:hypothetical protein